MIAAVVNVVVAAVDDVTPVQLLMASTGALTTAVSLLYRDCKRDREKLWAHVRVLEERLRGK